MGETKPKEKKKIPKSSAKAPSAARIASEAGLVENNGADDKVVSVGAKRPESAKTGNVLDIVLRQMELRDLSEVYELGSSLFTSERAATLYR